MGDTHVDHALSGVPYVLKDINALVIGAKGMGNLRFCLEDARKVLAYMKEILEPWNKEGCLRYLAESCGAVVDTTMEEDRYTLVKVSMPSITFTKGSHNISVEQMRLLVHKATAELEMPCPLGNSCFVCNPSMPTMEDIDSFWCSDEVIEAMEIHGFVVQYYTGNVKPWSATSLDGYVLAANSCEELAEEVIKYLGVQGEDNASVPG